MGAATCILLECRGTSPSLFAWKRDSHPHKTAKGVFSKPCRNEKMCGGYAAPGSGLHLPREYWRSRIVMAESGSAIMIGSIALQG